jgi:hypothetical protein
MQSDDHPDPTAVDAELTFRVQCDGRRERLAVVLQRDKDGVDRPWTRADRRASSPDSWPRRSGRLWRNCLPTTGRTGARHSATEADGS